MDEETPAVTKKITLFAIITFTIFFASPSLVQADERLVNGGFETGDTTGWDTFIPDPGSVQITASSAYTRTGNYSGAVTITGDVLGGQVGQCADIVPRNPLVEHFTVAGWVYVPADATNFNWARVRVQYWGDQFAGCAPSLGIVDSPNIAVTPGEWSYVELTSAIPAPDPERGAPVAVSVYLRVARTTTDVPLTVYWDDITFYDSTPTAVSLLSATTSDTADFIHPPFWLMAGLLAVLSWSFFRRKEAAQI
jgi:hypothetical protein